MLRVEPALLPRVVEIFGQAFVRGVTTFSLLDLVNELGVAVFEGGRISVPSHCATSRRPVAASQARTPARSPVTDQARTCRF